MSKKSATGSAGSTGEAGPLPPSDAARERNVVFYDGVCTFCDGWVQILYHLDTGKHLAFATLQSALGRELIHSHPRALGSIDSIIFVRNYGTKDLRIDIKSTAILRIMESLGGAWRLFAVGRLAPRFLRDIVYDWFARHRYQWFGKKNLQACMIPPPEDRDRFFN